MPTLDRRLVGRSMSSTTTKSSDEDQATGWRRFLTPSVGDVVFIVVFFGAVLMGDILTNLDGDHLRHLRLGWSILEGEIPRVDVYSYTVTGAELIPHWWLSQAGFALAERWFGFDGIGLLTALLAAIPWAIIYRWLVRRGVPVSLSVGMTLLGAAASVVHWAARPHAFTWVFIVAWMLLLEDLRTTRREQAWWLIPLSTLWANFHAGFIIGILLVATYLLGALWDAWRQGWAKEQTTRVRHLGLVLVGTAAASILTPAGIKTIINAYAYLGQDYLIDVTREYASPDFHHIFAWPFLLMILVSIVRSHRWNATHLLLVLSWTAAALYSLRNIPIYALVVTPVLALSLVGDWSRLRLPVGPRVISKLREYSTVERSLVGGTLAVAFAVTVSFAVVAAPGSRFGLRDQVFPIQAMETLGEAPGERPFHTFKWGGYLEYCCYPDVLVFIDGQTDIYGEEITSDYVEAIQAKPNWRAIFEKHGVDWVLVESTSPLAQVLEEASDWDELYRDDTAAVFVPA